MLKWTNETRNNEQDLLKLLRIKTGIQWRSHKGSFITFSGSVREKDSLELKGLNTSEATLFNGRTNDRVLAVTPQQAQAWLDSRSRHHQR